MNPTMATDSTGVPIKLLYQGEGNIVTVELKNAEIYRGMLARAEDTMNCQLKEVTMTAKDGRTVRLENVFLRGGNIKFIVLPEALKSSPILRKVQQLKSKKLEAENQKLGGSKTGGMGKNAKKPKTS